MSSQEFPISSSMPLLLDGGLGTELKRRSVPLHPASWSSKANVDNPAVVQKIHEDYLHAGADVITTNTMMAGRFVLKSVDISDFESFNKMSVAIAMRARQAAGSTSTLVAGSMSTLPPLNQHDRFFTGAKAVDAYRRQALALIDSGVDLLLLEMLIGTESAGEILQSCCELDIPVWAGLSAKKFSHMPQLMSFRPKGALQEEEHESFENLVQTVVQYPLAMVGVMHTNTEDMPEALSILNQRWTGPTMAYGNIGQSAGHDWVINENISTNEYVSTALDWTLSHNLSAIGGCCGTSPEHIQLLRTKLNSKSSFH